MRSDRTIPSVNEFEQYHIAVVIPCYQVEKTIAGVLNSLPDFIKTVVAVDDCSTDETPTILAELSEGNPRLIVVHHPENRGVGGATKTGYRKALDLGVQIVIKMDGDGQMDAVHIPAILPPLLSGRADYCKGNRFHDWKFASTMPAMRKIGNLGLSLLTKGASGYWNVFDPTNGYTAISADLLRQLDFDVLQNRYLFETSMLVELYYRSAIIHQFPMEAVYQGAGSSLSIFRSLLEFPPYLIRASFTRFIRKYIFQDFSALTIFFLLGMLLLIFGVVFGSYNWIQSVISQQPATAGTVILSAVPTILGFQMLLQAIVLDIQNTPGGSR